MQRTDHNETMTMNNASCLPGDQQPLSLSSSLLAPLSSLLSVAKDGSAANGTAAAALELPVLLTASFILGIIGLLIMARRRSKSSLKEVEQIERVKNESIESTISSEKVSAGQSKSKTKDKLRKITYEEFRSTSAAATGMNGEKFGTNEKDTNTTENINKPQWIIINTKVYDITNFTAHHPGGSVIDSMIGRDATDVFAAFHLPRVLKRLGSKAVPCVGELVDGPPIKPATADYRKLRNKLWAEGMFECSLVPYQISRDIIALSIFALGLVVIVYGSTSLVRVLGGGFLVGLALQQIAFVAHDAGHRGITHPKSGGSWNLLGWFHGTVCFGVSSEMWLYEHSMHHALTMEPHEDPQFNYLPVWLVSAKELGAYSKKSGIDRALARWLVPVQHITMIPLSMIIGRFNLHAISIGWCIKHLRIKPWRLVAELGGFVLYFAWFGYVVSLLPSSDAAVPAMANSVLPSWIPIFLTGERFWFVMVSYITAGLLHIQLTISHLALEAFTADEEESEQFFYHQMKTTRNIDTTKWDEWFHGGLQYQIEHHLFPQLPRHNLAKVKPMVEELCKKHDMQYESVGFCYAVWYCLKDFKRLANIFMGHIEG